MVAYKWDGVSLIGDGVVENTDTTGNHRLVVVMPPAPGLHTSYLIVGTENSPTLHVISLPDRRLVHTHTLEGKEVVGLAADPSGTALAVCDKVSRAVHVLSWPLPGMPAMAKSASSKVPASFDKAQQSSERQLTHSKPTLSHRHWHYGLEHVAGVNPSLHPGDLAWYKAHEPRPLCPVSTEVRCPPLAFPNLILPMGEYTSTEPSGYSDLSGP